MAEAETLTSLTSDLQPLPTSPSTPPPNPHLSLLRSQIERLSLVPIPRPEARDVVQEGVRRMRGVIEEMEKECLGLESGFESDEFESYLIQLKEKTCSLDEEAKELSYELQSHAETYTRDFANFGADYVELNCALSLIDIQESDQHQVGDTLTGSYDLQEPLSFCNADYNLEMLELRCLVEKESTYLFSLMDLEVELRRDEAIALIDEIFYDIKVLDFEGSSLRLLLQAPSKFKDDVLVRQKLGPLLETCGLDHEMTIDITNGIFEPRNVQVLPEDVYLDEIIHTAKSSRYSFCWLLRHVQRQILLCSLRLLVVKAVNQSRRSVEYRDKDATITAHLIGGVDVQLKVLQGWPVVDCGLQLISVVDNHPKCISLSILSKVQEKANSLDKQIRTCLASFIDAIEGILVQETQPGRSSS